LTDDEQDVESENDDDAPTPPYVSFGLLISIA